jgi:hypothetical protein
MDQASPEGVASPEVSSASVVQQPPAQNTAEGQPTAAAESQPAPVETKQEPKGVAKRIDELTRNWRESQRTNERLLAMLEQQRTAAQAPPPRDEQPKALKDFNYDERAYQDHLYTEARKHAEKAARDAGEKWRMEQEAIGRRAKFDERVAQFAKTVEDYSDVVTDSTPVSEGMADFLLDSDEAGAVMYYLGNNPDEARKLYHLSPAKAGRELTKLEDRLVAERKKAAAKPVSNAPPPAPRIEAAGEAGLRVDPTSAESDALSDTEWLRKREKQLQSRRK